MLSQKIRIQTLMKKKIFITIYYISLKKNYKNVLFFFLHENNFFIWKSIIIIIIWLDYYCFYYCAGVISGALLYIRDEFPAVEKKTWLQVNEFLRS